MELLREALRAGHNAAAGATPAQAAALVVGGGGTLGAALVEQALARYATVQVVVDEPILPAMRGFAALPLEQLLGGAPLPAATAFIVFDRVRAAFGREAAFHQPQPDALARLGTALRRGGVRRLIVVLPHAPALLPQALRHGLASLDEQALAALGFEQLVIVRSAQAGGGGPRRGPWLQRLADAFLAQLHWMLAQGDQPVRAPKVAAFALTVAQALDGALPATRIAPPELVWLASQPGDVDALVRLWLADGQVPPLPPRRRHW